MLIKNKLILHKAISTNYFRETDYHEFRLLVDEWLKEIEQKKRQDKEEEEKYKKQQKSYSSNTNQPKVKIPKTPKLK